MHSLSAQPIQPLLDSISKILDKQKIPGAMVAIVRSDTVLYAGGIGLANVKEEIPVSPEHLFRIGSVSKSFTAFGMMRLVEQGRLKLTDQVLAIDPDLPIVNPWEETHPITIENLLEHTAGFDDMHFHAFYNTTDQTAPPIIEMVNEHRKSLLSRWPPGTKMSYSNPGYVILGHIIEKVTGQPFHEFIKEEVLNPLGMDRSGFYFQSPEEEHPMAVGYKFVNGDFRVERYLPINGDPAGSMCANAEEMALFLQVMLRGQLPDSTMWLSVESLKRIPYPQTTLAAKAGLQHGYGLANFVRWMNGYPFHGHNGGIDGFGSEYMYSREADIAWAISINTLKSPNKIYHLINDYFVPPDTTSKSKRLTQDIPQEVAQQYEGFYLNDSPRQQSQAFIEQLTKGVYLKFEKDYALTSDFYDKPKDTLWYAGNRQFYRGDRPFPTIILLEDEHHKPVLWHGNTYAKKTSRPLLQAQVAALSSALIALVFFLIYGSIWLFLRMTKVVTRPAQSRLVLWGACLGFMGIPLGMLLTIMNMSKADSITPQALFIFIGSMLFFVLATWSVYLSFKQKSEPLPFRIYYAASAFLIAGLSLFLLYHGMIGFRVWAY